MRGSGCTLVTAYLSPREAQGKDCNHTWRDSFRSGFEPTSDVQEQHDFGQWMKLSEPQFAYLWNGEAMLLTSRGLRDITSKVLHREADPW